MIIKAIEKCYNQDEEIGMREVYYETDKTNLLDATIEYENNFNLDKIVSTDDFFDGECQDSELFAITIISDKDIKCDFDTERIFKVCEDKRKSAEKLEKIKNKLDEVKSVEKKIQTLIDENKRNLLINALVTAKPEWEDLDFNNVTDAWIIGELTKFDEDIKNKKGDLRLIIMNDDIFELFTDIDVLESDCMNFRVQDGAVLVNIPFDGKSAYLKSVQAEMIRQMVEKFHGIKLQVNINLKN